MFLVSSGISQNLYLCFLPLVLADSSLNVVTGRYPFKCDKKAVMVGYLDSCQNRFLCLLLKIISQANLGPTNKALNSFVCIYFVFVPSLTAIFLVNIEKVQIKQSFIKQTFLSAD